MMDGRYAARIGIEATYLPSGETEGDGWMQRGASERSGRFGKPHSPPAACGKMRRTGPVRDAAIRLFRIRNAKGTHPGGYVPGIHMVGMSGFEPPASASRTQRSSQTEPHPDKWKTAYLHNRSGLGKKFRRGCFSLPSPVKSGTSCRARRRGCCAPRIPVSAASGRTPTPGDSARKGVGGTGPSFFRTSSGQALFFETTRSLR